MSHLLFGALFWFLAKAEGILKVFSSIYELESTGFAERPWGDACLAGWLRNPNVFDIWPEKNNTSQSRHFP